MRTLHGLFLAAFGTALILPSVGVAADSYATYRNARYGYSVQYPANLLTPQRESDNGDGRTFLSADKKVRLTVYATYNTENRTVRQEQERVKKVWQADKARVTYWRRASDYFVTSGYFRDRIFYEKTVRWNGAFHTMLWEYPPSQKKQLDAAVTRAFNSFSAANFRIPRVSSLPAPRPQVAINDSVPAPTQRPLQARTVVKHGY